MASPNDGADQLGLAFQLEAFGFYASKMNRFAHQAAQTARFLLHDGDQVVALRRRNSPGVEYVGSGLNRSQRCLQLMGQRINHHRFQLFTLAHRLGLIRGFLGARLRQTNGDGVAQRLNQGRRQRSANESEAAINFVAERDRQGRDRAVLIDGAVTRNFTQIGFRDGAALRRAMNLSRAVLEKRGLLESEQLHTFVDEQSVQLVRAAIAQKNGAIQGM